MKKLALAFLYALVLNIHSARSDIVDITMKREDSYQNGLDAYAHWGYYNMTLNITATGGDVYLASGVTYPDNPTDFVDWRFKSPDQTEATGRQLRSALTTAHTTWPHGYLLIRDGYTEEIRFEIGFENLSPQNVMVRMELQNMQYATSESGSLINYPIDLHTKYMFLAANPMVPEPHSFTLLMMGLAGLRMVMKRK